MTTPVEVTCRHCLLRFKAARSLKGGLTNCPQCGKATEVPGGPEPLFWALLGGGGLVVLAVAYLVAQLYGAAAGLAVVLLGAVVIGIAVAAS